MGWGTYFMVKVFLNRKNFSNKQQVKEEIENVKDDIKRSEELLKMYASSTPKDVVDEEFKNQPLEFIYNEINRIVQELSDSNKELFLLKLYKDYLDEQYNME